MPEVSRFLGIIIRMFHRGEHGPAHFHATYGGKTIRIEIETLSPMDQAAGFSPRVRIDCGVGVAASGGAAGELAARYGEEALEED